MPCVTVDPRPKGLPIAITQSPIRDGRSAKDAGRPGLVAIGAWPAGAGFAGGLAGGAPDAPVARSRESVTAVSQRLRIVRGTFGRAEAICVAQSYAKRM